MDGIKKQMKAYCCRQDIDPCSTIVFAETAGKARYIAKSYGMLGDDLEFRDIHVRRVPQLDKYYKGQHEMDWYNDEDRIAMVREAGFTCGEDMFDPDECGRCPAVEYCDVYKDYVKDQKFWDEYDHCYECRGLGDDYIINDDGELESYCDKCGCNPNRSVGEDDG